MVLFKKQEKKDLEEINQKENAEKEKEKEKVDVNQEKIDVKLLF